MIIRQFWTGKIEAAWKQRPIVWLFGVRRVGKTTLAKMFSDAIYLNCDLPSTSRRLADPELFFEQVNGNRIIIFDEIHRLENPSLILKIAADEYPELRILATGSSTLAATHKFRDSLTGRKQSILLPPVLWTECQNEFNQKDLDHRLIQGGLPEMLLANEKKPEFYAEWLDSFYARDIQELFSIRQRTGFLKMLRLLFCQSGGLLNNTNLAKLSELSRPTVNSYLEAMQIANAIYLLPPFHGGGRREILQQRKCYGFDTGFITYLNGWSTLRSNERGLLWEHLVLDTLRTFSDEQAIFYWRDKSDREVDFIIKTRNDRVLTLECKISLENYDPKSLIAFRTLYPDGDNYLVCPFIKESYQVRIENHILRVVGMNDILKLPALLQA
ncbi:MAG: ATP-binding protein [Fidelibacterota bacterium]